MPGSAKDIDTNNNGTNMESRSCDPAWLDQSIQNGINLLIFDFRTANDFQKSHIEGAVPIGSAPTLMKTRFIKGTATIEKLMNKKDREKYSQLRNGIVVVYDSEGLDSDLHGNIDKFIDSVLKQLRENGGQLQLLTGKQSVMSHPSTTKARFPSSLKFAPEHNISVVWTVKVSTNCVDSFQ